MFTRLWRRWRPIYLIIHENQPLFLECDINEDMGCVLMHRWTRNPNRATPFSEREKRRAELWNTLPKEARWYCTITL